MGADATRITAADFVTPPELGDWRLADDGAGRVGGVRLALISHSDHTSLGACYQQVPLRVLPPFQFGAGQPALLYLMNPTAGLMDGDGQRIDLIAGPKTRAVIVGQSATRVHPCLRGFATQQWNVSVDSGAVLVVLPGPAIPFHQCRYFQRIEINLAADASLIWGDVWLAGRYARGDDSESFQFETIVQELAVRREGALVFRDRFCWQGPWDAATARFFFGGAPACGSLFVTGTVEETSAPAFRDLRQGWFPTAAGDTCVRWLGSSEAVTDALVRSALQLASQKAGRGVGESWLGAADLAPCHWFSPMRT
jgi:urease accessory protein